MTEKLAGHLLVESLVAQGVTHAFGVPGESYLAVLDGFHVHADRIRFVTCRQEGGAAFMAEAQGKLTGRPGVCFVTRGPGATNASIGVHTAFQDSTPMVLFVGDVASDSGIGRPFRRSISAASSVPAPRVWPSGSSASTTRAGCPNTWRAPSRRP
jgi:acetolactate synthase-1/2/3 large subunit